MVEWCILIYIKPFDCGRCIITKFIIGGHVKYGADTTVGVQRSRFNFAMHDNDNIGFTAEESCPTFEQTS